MPIRRLPVVRNTDGSVSDPECAMCTAACCRSFPDIPITRAEYDSGLYEAHELKPGLYSLRIGDDLRCPHLGRDDRCTVYDHRPRTCQVYSCRSDTRITRVFKSTPGL